MLGAKAGIVLANTVLANTVLANTVLHLLTYIARMRALVNA